MLDQEQPDLPEIREALGDIASDGNRASDIIDHIRSASWQNCVGCCSGKPDCSVNQRL
jgi:hypothetical protein